MNEATFEDNIRTPFDVVYMLKPFLVKEGLIKTYPTDKVVKSIANNFNFSVDGVVKDGLDLWSLRGGEKPEINGDISIIKPNGVDEMIVITLKNEEYYQSLNNHLLKYGWFNSRTDDVDGSLKHFYEKKFGDRFTAGQLLNITDRIYHITSSVLKKKILDQGLIPKESKTPGFENEPRIYFRPDLPSIDDVSELNVMKGVFNAPAMVVEVDVKKLKTTHAFFYDSRWTNSIFTFEPIPVEAIRIMGENELLRIKLV